MQDIFWGHHICCGQRKEPWSAGTKHPHTHPFPYSCPHTHPPPYHHPMISRNKLKKPTCSSASYFTTPQHHHMFHPARTWATTTLIRTTPALLVRRPTTLPRKLVVFPAFHPGEMHQFQGGFDSHARIYVYIYIHIYTYVIFLFNVYVYIYIDFTTNQSQKTQIKKRIIESYQCEMVLHTNVYIYIHIYIYTVYILISTCIPWEGEDVNE